MQQGRPSGRLPAVESRALRREVLHGLLRDRRHAGHEYHYVYCDDCHHDRKAVRVPGSDLLLRRTVRGRDGHPELPARPLGWHLRLRRDHRLRRRSGHDERGFPAHRATREDWQWRRLVQGRHRRQHRGVPDGLGGHQERRPVGERRLGDQGGPGRCPPGRPLPHSAEGRDWLGHLREELQQVRWAGLAADVRGGGGHLQAGAGRLLGGRGELQERTGVAELGRGLLHVPLPGPPRRRGLLGHRGNRRQPVQWSVLRRGQQGRLPPLQERRGVGAVLARGHRPAGLSALVSRMWSFVSCDTTPWQLVFSPRMSVSARHAGPLEAELTIASRRCFGRRREHCLLVRSLFRATTARHKGLGISHPRRTSVGCASVESSVLHSALPHASSPADHSWIALGKKCPAVFLYEAVSTPLGLEQLF
mmetsp:Transcript_78643/g.208724  ORF Transcript_78643/g.208724 Transcript_78643/m.208724 type:complete len:419 (+) Transcript_78643:750-2006(+)